MRCEKAKLKIDAYVCGELPPELGAAIEEHLKSCDDCRQAVAALRRMVSLARVSHTPPVPEGFAERVMALARARAAETPGVAAGIPFQWRRVASMPMRAAAAAILVVGLLVGSMMGWGTLPASAGRPAAKAMLTSDLLTGYNLDTLGEAPEGSLANSYLALVLGPDGEGR